MNFTLETFASEVQKLLQNDSSPAGREKVRDLVQEALKDEKFIATYVNDNTPDRQVVYEDPQLGFCICAHVNRDAREANPHDHGASWALPRAGPLGGRAAGKSNGPRAFGSCGPAMSEI